MHRLLVTGAASWTGGRLVRRLESISDFRVFAVDDRPPRVEFTSEFHRTGLDDPSFAEYFLDVRPDTVAHLQTLDRQAELGGRQATDHVVLGAHALFGAIARSATVRNVVVKSDWAIYGSGPRNPSILSESTASRVGRSRYERDLDDVERFVTEVAAELPAVTFTVLRFAAIIGPEVANPLSRFLSLPVVPTRLGFDPRLQFIYEEDAVRALMHAVQHSTPGTFNVAAEQPIYLSRALRLGRRPPQPLPGALAFDRALSALARTGLRLPLHVRAVLQHGRVLNVDRMVHELGFRPALDGRSAVLAAYQRIDPAELPPEVRSE